MLGFVRNITWFQQHYETVRRYPVGNGHAAESVRQVSGGESVAPPHDPEEEHHDAPSTPPADVTAQEELHEDAPSSPPIVNVNVHGAPAPSAAPLPTFTSVPDPELVGQLHDAQAEIERLRHLISSMPDPSTAPTTTTSPELRRRHRPLSDDGSTFDGETDVATYVSEDSMTQSEGVPLQVVIIIALGVFITTYLFF